MASTPLLRRSVLTSCLKFELAIKTGTAGMFLSLGEWLERRLMQSKESERALLPDTIRFWIISPLTPLFWDMAAEKGVLTVKTLTSSSSRSASVMSDSFALMWMVSD